MPRYKYFFNRVLTAIQNLFLGIKLSEYHTGYRTFTRKVIETLPLLECSDDFVQVPGNVLDQRAIRARGRSAVPLDVRSVYLQGVLLDDPKLADARAPGLAGITAALQAAAAALDTGLAPLLIASMLKVIRPGDRLVIGIDNVSQLDVLPAAFEIPDDIVQEFQTKVARLTDDPALSILLDPRRWPGPLPD